MLSIYHGGSDSVDVFLMVPVFLFFCFGWLSRKKIAYFFCPLKKYSSYEYGRKAFYIGTMHLVIAIGLCVITFDLLYNITALNQLFKNTAFRITSFMVLWFAWLFFLGLLIEIFLVRTDEEYRIWKQDYLKKGVELQALKND
jgi:hypothetical protein